MGWWERAKGPDCLREGCGFGTRAKTRCAKPPEKPLYVGVWRYIPQASWPKKQNIKQIILSGLKFAGENIAVKTKGGLDIPGAVALEPINGPRAPGRQAQGEGGSSRLCP